MAKNYVEEGEILPYTTGGAAVASGAVVLMGKRLAVALGDIPANSTGSVAVTGVWAITKLATDVVNQGDLLYWDSGNSRLTVTVGANTLAGFAAAAAGNGVAAVNIKINA